MAFLLCNRNYLDLLGQLEDGGTMAAGLLILMTFTVILEI